MRGVAQRLGYCLGCVWTLPNTLLGLAFVVPAWIGGGSVRWFGGNLEVYGGGAAWFLRRCCRNAAALTLGQVILARDAVTMEIARLHEYVHVWQYRRWGPLFLPAYALSSLWAWLRGRDPYRDNYFERQAFELAD